MPTANSCSIVTGSSRRPAMSAQERPRKRRVPPRNDSAMQPPGPCAVSSSGASSDQMTPSQSALPFITLGQLKLLARTGAQLRATIRATGGAYLVEVGFGPRRRQFVSAHWTRPRLLRGLDGVANAARDLGPMQVRLELGRR